MGFEENEGKYAAKKDIEEVVKAINSAYRVSKLNFIWQKKWEENKKTVSEQLEGVSEVISSLANQMTIEEVEEYAEQKQEIRGLLKQKEIEVKDLVLKKEKTGRWNATLYTDVCENVDGKQCGVKKIARILTKVLGQDMKIQKQTCGLRLEEDTCMFHYLGEDNYHLQVGIAKSKKADSPISGDSSIQTKLEDGKYLLALSDGMGSGPEARKSSKIAIKMLERLLTSGFDKEMSLKLILH